MCAQGQFKDEFVKAGGVPLKEVTLSTMESRVCPGLVLAGEVRGPLYRGLLLKSIFLATRCIFPATRSIFWRPAGAEMIQIPDATMCCFACWMNARQMRCRSCWYLERPTERLAGRSATQPDRTLSGIGCFLEVLVTFKGTTTGEAHFLGFSLSRITSGGEGRVTRGLEAVPKEGRC